MLMYCATVFASTNLLDKLFHLIHLFKGFICFTQSRVNYHESVNSRLYFITQFSFIFHLYHQSCWPPEDRVFFIATKATVVNISLATNLWVDAQLVVYFWSLSFLKIYQYCAIGVVIKIWWFMCKHLSNKNLLMPLPLMPSAISSQKYPYFIF